MIRKIDRRGKRVLVIDIRYTKPDGSKGRFRHDAQVQTMPAATAEERRLVANIAQHGDVHEPVGERRMKATAPERRLVPAASNNGIGRSKPAKLEPNAQTSQIGPAGRAPSFRRGGTIASSRPPRRSRATVLPG